MSTKRTTNELMQNAWKAGTAIPAFNIPYLPMMEPVVRALRDTRSFGLIMVARLEWVKFESGSMHAIHDEYQQVKDERHTRLHLDHLPVIDEDQLTVPYFEELSEAVKIGYESIMIDASRLSLDENIAATKRVVDMAHEAEIPVEAELGAVMGHEEGPMPPYEELFASGKGFTDPKEARRFVEETGVDWLSIAVGSVHGAISAAKKSQKKVEARLSIDQLKAIRAEIDIPFVLHGGTGIRKEYIMDAIKNGIAKINVATAIRQPYEAQRDSSLDKAKQAVYDSMVSVITEELELAGSVDTINPE